MGLFKDLLSTVYKCRSLFAIEQQAHLRNIQLDYEMEVRAGIQPDQTLYEQRLHMLDQDRIEVERRRRRGSRIAYSICTLAFMVTVWGIVLSAGKEKWKSFIGDVCEPGNYKLGKCPSTLEILAYAFMGLLALIWLYANYFCFQRLSPLTYLLGLLVPELAAFVFWVGMTLSHGDGW